MSDEGEIDGDRLRRIAEGDQAAFADAFERFRDRLRYMVRLRLDHRLQGRVDPSDIIQDAYLEAARRAKDYAAEPKMPFYLWLRFLTGQRLLQVQRLHIGAQMRNAEQEISIHRAAWPEASSISLAAQLVGNLTSPSLAAVRAEMQVRLQNALNEMDPVDREVLTLRHFEELGNNEVAEVLGLTKTAASNRYMRALKRLRDVLSSIPGFLEQ